MKKGFTLIEMSVVLLIIALILGASVVTLNSTVKKTQYDTTIDKMAIIEKSLLDFSLSNRRLPCPASLTQTIVSNPTTYGFEDTNYNGTCTNANYQASTATGAFEGTIPVRSLGLPENYMYDAYGRRFRYAVNPDFNIAANYPLPVPEGGIGYPSSKNIIIKDAAGNIRSSQAIYAIISHGENGHGGFTTNGVAFNAGSTNADEQTNCHCDSSANMTTPWASAATYIQKLPSTTSTTDLTKKFDDIVVYKEAWQMRSPDTQIITAPNNIYIADSGAGANKTIQKYNTSTLGWTTLTDLPSSGVPQGLFVDNNQNIWAIDSNNKKIIKSTDGGASWTSLASLTLPYNVYVDPTGNVWVADSLQIKESTDGGNNFSIKVGGLSSPQGISGNNITNIWVADTGNNLIKQYDGSSLTTCTTANNSFSSPKGIYVDAANNVWVADSGNNRIQKCAPSNNNSTCTCIYWGGNATGTSNGQFNAPTNIIGDAAGNIWVTDSGNQRIQKYANGQWSIFFKYGAVAATQFTTSLYGIATSGR